MARAGLWLARAVLWGWVGASTMFVLLAVLQTTSPLLTSEDKDILVTLQFPWYYRGGFVLVGLGWLGTLLAGRQLASGPRWVTLVLLTAALVTMTADYWLIYQPLAAMVTPPGQPRPMQFQPLHQWSRWINTVHWLLSLVAACCVNPSQPRAPASES